MKFAKCPTDQDLADFSCGKIADVKIDPLAEHLDKCTDCQRRIERSDVSTDALTTAIVGSASSTDEFSEDDVYQRLATIAPWSRQRCSSNTTDSHLTLPPRRIAGCELQRKLGSGGMGVVYGGIHNGLGRPVAVKLLNGDRIRDDRASERFHREMTALGRVDHPNVVKAYDAGEENGVAYLVMELIDGLNVGQIQRRSETLSISAACEAIRQAALGLQHAHSQGLVHRDIKPSNLMVYADGTVKVVDLGLAMLSDLRAAPAKADISSRMVMGTIEYMAPEQMTSMHDEHA